MNLHIGVFRPEYAGGLAAYACALLLGMIAGLLASTGSIQWVVLGTAPLLGMLVAVSRVHLFWIVVIGALVVAGTVRLYVPSLQLVRWAIAGGAVALWVHVLLNACGDAGKQRMARLPGPAVWMLALVAVALLSTLVNRSELTQVSVAAKGYFQIWGLYFALALLTWPPRTIATLARVILIIGLIQVPFAFHQYLVLVPTREGLGGGVVPIDVVSGTFGADRLGGGSSALLAMYQCTVVAALLGLWREGLLAGGWVLALTTVLLVPVALCEAKIAVIYVLTIFLVLYLSDLIRRPARFLGGSVVLGAGFAALMTSYTVHVPNKEVHNWLDLIEYTAEYNVEKTFGVNGSLSRWSTITFWVQQHGLRDVPGTLIGHGIGASRESEGFDLNNIAETEYAGRGIGRTAIPALLWDTGILGAACIVGMLLSAYRCARRVAHSEAVSPNVRGIHKGLQAGILMVFFSLWYNDYFIFDLVYQAVLMLILGYIAYWDRLTQVERTTRRW